MRRGKSPGLVVSAWDLEMKKCVSEWKLGEKRKSRSAWSRITVLKEGFLN
jgi:hypothetical protein